MNRRPWLTVSLVNNLMLVSGGFGVLASSQPVRVVSLSVSAVLFLFLMYGFRVLFAYVLQRVVRTVHAHIHTCST